ncbi:tryptophanyl-tRNA synthetase [Parathielavia appendiculata]|uniref:Tryptophan--tRNA ligase, cytoplasmic n=1 Tax=Parathielavia appendiculata TaxID=2587402 RepID=A0AAN6U6Y4_9PEZI|nr:tryptophanyl-tRNA synthetase [Parathielavia appendiculata]
MATKVDATAHDEPSNSEPVQKQQKQTVDPYNVQGEVDENGVVKAIDYNKLVDEFGTKKIDDELLARLERVTGKRPHHFLRRGIVFSHRDLELILDRYERGEPFFLYTGRGPSSDSVHVGHTIPFEFTKWLQDTFDVPLIIMLTDDEKYLFSEKKTIEEVQGYCNSNAKDIIAIGFDPAKTFIFSDFDYVGGAFYRNIVRLSKHITLNQARAIFGFNESSNIGRIHFGSIQGATSWASSFPHIFGEDEKETVGIPALIPCAIDQDPYFRMTRDVSARLKYQGKPYAKPSLIHALFLPALQGPGTKMSASIDESAIFMRDTPNQIKNKINKHAFSGGKVSEEEHRQLGGDTSVDVAFQYLRFFLEDDEELERIKVAYETGEMLTGELKAICIRELQRYVAAFQDRRAKVDDETVKLFMETRPLKWGGNPRAPIVIPKVENGDADESPADGEGKMTKNQLKKLEKMRQAEAKKAQKAKEKAEQAAAKAAGPSATV